MFTDQYQNLLYTFRKVNLKTFLLSIMAGIFISIGAVSNLMSQNLIEGNIGKLIGSIFFSIGLILVFVAGAELFTGKNILIGTAIKKIVTFKHLLKYWIVVYIGNFIGCFLMALLIYLSKIFNDKSIINLNKLIITKNSKTFLTLLVLGILCNMLVCLAVWMNCSSKSIADKILIPIFPITIFVFCGFEHSIADMFYLALNNFYSFNISTFWVLLPVTIGNVLGGMFIGLIYYIVSNDK